MLNGQAWRLLESWCWDRALIITARGALMQKVHVQHSLDVNASGDLVDGFSGRRNGRSSTFMAFMRFDFWISVIGTHLDWNDWNVNDIYSIYQRKSQRYLQKAGRPGVSRFPDNNRPSSVWFRCEWAEVQVMNSCEFFLFAETPVVLVGDWLSLSHNLWNLFTNE